MVRHGVVAGSLAGLLIGAAAVLAAETAEPEAQATRAIMARVFGALQRALPASLDEGRFSDPTRREEIGEALATLARHAEQLEGHGVNAGASFAFLSRSLARDAREIERRFTAGRPSEARFLLHGITDTCAACHARLLDPDDASLSSRFMDGPEIAALPLDERATLAMATRQFDRALEAQEAMFTSPEFDVTSIDLLGYLDDYLEICLRVKRDHQRPARVIESFARRDDVRPELRSELEQWVSDLRELGARAPVEGLENARALVKEAEHAAERFGERAHAVRYHAASGALHRFVASVPPNDARAAEAYYWLGVIESRVGHSFWLSQTEPYLEAAIRLAPGDPLAREAYSLLEEHVVLGYTGSGGEHVPPDVRQWLDELYRLIAVARAEEDS